MNNSIVYSSGINIWDKSDLSTLSVFWDKIILPATSDTTIGKMVGFARKKNSNDSYKLQTISLQGFRFEDRKSGLMHSAENYAKQWNDDYNALFSEGIMERMPRLIDRARYSYIEDFESDGIESILLDFPLILSSTGSSRKYWNEPEDPVSNPTEYHDNLYLWEDHFIHLRRTDIQKPQVFVTKERDMERDIIKSILAQSAFTAFVPKLVSLPPQEILEIRRKVSSNREGFSLYLQNLSKNLDDLMRQGAPFKDIQFQCNSVVETEIVPLYYEFQRQLRSEKVGWIGKILDVTNEIFSIDSAPWTPKFYGDIAKALGSFVVEDLGNKESKTNQAQAFKFIRKLRNHPLLQG